MAEPASRTPVEIRRYRNGNVWFDVCQACGATSGDNDLHQKWHAALEQSAPSDGAR